MDILCLAEDILKDDDSIRPSTKNKNAFCVWDNDDNVAVVKVDGEGFPSCSCREYHSFHALCGHVVAFAQRNGNLMEFLQKTNESVAEKDQLLALGQSGVNEGAGFKPGQKRRGTAASGNRKHASVVDSAVAVQPLDIYEPDYPSAEELEKC